MTGSAMFLSAFSGAALAAALAASAASAMAEDLGGADLTAPPPITAENMPALLSGTLKKIHDSAKVVIGYRNSAFPFSYARGGAPIGYSIDLCAGVVAEIARELNGEPLTAEYRPVSAESRVDAVASGTVDLECGSTTNTAERREKAAFSPLIFVAGTKLMVRRGSNIASIRDLKGKTLVVTRGTTNEAAVQNLNEKFALMIKIVSTDDPQDSFTLLSKGEADAFASDDVLLYGLVASAGARDRFEVVGNFLTYEPYGLMFRKDDPEMAEAVSRAFGTMAATGTLTAAYRKWFLSPTPTGESLALPMSPQLSESFRAMGAEAF